MRHDTLVGLSYYSSANTPRVIVVVFNPLHRSICGRLLESYSTPVRALHVRISSSSFACQAERNNWCPERNAEGLRGTWPKFHNTTPRRFGGKTPYWTTSRTMPEYPYADNMYSSLDDSDVEDRDELYSVAAGLGLGDSSSYRPGGPTGQQQPQQHQHDQHQHTAEEEEALSPSDGYFGRSQPQFEESTPSAYPSDSYTSFQSQRQHRDQVPLNTSTPASIPRSSQVPHVPNVWVSDPSLSQESTDKANEAQQERSQYENNRRLAAADQHHLDPATPDHSSLTSPTAGASPGASNVLSPSLLPNSPQPATATRSAATASYVSSPRTAAHRYTPSNTSSSAAGPYHPRRTYSERSSLFSEAPPAYTPSPTSPTSNASGGTSNNYQTFSPTSRTAPGFSTMGRLSESESHGLLAGQNYNAIPQSMGGELDPNDDGHFEYPRPSGWRDRLRQFSWRRHWKLVLLGIVLTFVTLGFLVSSFLGVKNEVSCFLGRCCGRLYVTLSFLAISCGTYT